MTNNHLSRTFDELAAEEEVDADEIAKFRKYFFLGASITMIAMNAAIDAGVIHRVRPKLADEIAEALSIPTGPGH